MKRLKLIKLVASSLVIASVISLNPIRANAEVQGWKQIDGKWYYFYSDGTKAVNTIIEGCVIGYDGVWVEETSSGSSSNSARSSPTSPGTYNGGPTSTGSYQSTGSSSSTNEAYKSTQNSSDQQSIGFDKISLASDTTYLEIAEKFFYNKASHQIADVNSLSIGGIDYKQIYTKGNIVGRGWPVDENGLNGEQIVYDYCFDINNNYTRFTAITGIDDYYRPSNAYQNIEDGQNAVDTVKQRTGTIDIIGDGNILQTVNLKYGQQPVNIDANITGCNKLIIRVKIYSGNNTHPCVFTYYDILNGQFYLKAHEGK